jgi:hypothetical protein
MKETLKDIFKTVNEWVRFGDVKNAGILAASMALTAGLLKFIEGDISKYWLYFSITVIFTACAVAMFALIGFSPILNKFFNKKPKKTPTDFNVYFFGDIRHFFDFKSEKHIEYIRLVNAKSSIYPNTYLHDKLEEDLAMQIITNSLIAFRKFKLFGFMVKLYFVGVALAFIVPFVVNYFQPFITYNNCCCCCCN